ncbi:unnamed protein product [Trichobilharzia szidati]|nr:unnamed protein product [Trichobilharzia szidati]
MKIATPTFWMVTIVIFFINCVDQMNASHSFPGLQQSRKMDCHSSCDQFLYNPLRKNRYKYTKCLKRC